MYQVVEPLGHDVHGNRSRGVVLKITTCKIPRGGQPARTLRAQCSLVGIVGVKVRFIEYHSISVGITFLEMCPLTDATLGGQADTDTEFFY